jgi:DNA-binding response OmpR family regulator
MANKKILIVDYDSNSLDSMASIFEPYEFQIIKATDGLSAYDSFQKEKPDLVILEAMLPKLHGFDLAKKISTESKGRVPVIIVTGLYRGPVYRNEALNYLGASEYFEKPYEEAKLVESALNLLKEEEEIKEELPDSDAILESLSQRFKNSFKDAKVEKPPEEKKEVEPPSKEPKKEEAPKEKKEEKPPKAEKKSSDSDKKDKPEIDEDVVDEISSLLDEKKKEKE